MSNLASLPKPKILIFEGIPTSGKTTLISKLAKSLEKFRTKIIFESETWMPLIDNKTPEFALHFLDKITDNLPTDLDFLIIDRLHLTHIFKTDSSLDFFDKIEEKLVNLDAKLVFLTVESEQIWDRIEKSFKHRDISWQDYVTKKGDKMEISNYYQSQQQKLGELAYQSKLNCLKINTTNQDFESYAKEIFNFVNPPKVLPIVAAGALILNEKNEIFLMESSGKFGSDWIVPGGKVDFGENVIDGLVREIREETNLEIFDIEFLSYRDYCKPNKHFIFMEFLAKTKNESDVKLNEEATKYGFFGQNELQKLNIATPTKDLINSKFAFDL